MPNVIAPLQAIEIVRVQGPPVPVSVLRLDKIPPAFSGNKYFKLKYNLEQAAAQGLKRLVSYGGAYSNHIHALALAGQQHGFDTVGIIRGERTQPLNPTLADAERAGMHLHFMTRQQYRLKHDAESLNTLTRIYPDSYIIPEGGSNILAVRGCMEIVDHVRYHLNDDFDVIVLPCATAATLTGIVAALPADKLVIGIAVLNNAGQQQLQVAQYLTELGLADRKHWRIEADYHCGGYAKLSKELLKFMAGLQQHNSQQHNKIDIEPIYSGKMFYALSQLLEKNAISCDARVVAIHTGGLQGLRGMKARMDRYCADLT